MYIIKSQPTCFLCTGDVCTDMGIQSQSKNYEEQIAKYLEVSSVVATTTNTSGTSEPSRMATPDDYDNEELYEEMSTRFYVSF